MNERSCNLCFLIANLPHLYLEKLLIWIYCPKIFSSKPNQLALVSHAQLCLEQSDSKILETPITHEKSKLFIFFVFFFIWILIERSYKLVFSSLCQGMLKDSRYRDAFFFIIFIINAIVFYLTSVKIHINYKSN